MTSLVHRAMIYERDNAYLGVAVPFVTEGLRVGDVVLAIGPSTGVDGLRRALGSRAGAVEFRDAAHWYAQPTRTIAAYSSFITDHPGARLRVLAEPAWRCDTIAEVIEWTRYESIVNMAFAEIDASVLCLYNRRTTTRDVLDGALCTHPEMVGRSGSRANGAYLDPPAVFADIDARPLPPAPERAPSMPVDSIDLRALRSFVGGHADHHGITSARRHDLLVATTEVATNAIRHGLPPVVCRVWADDTAVLVDVTDTGQWQPPYPPGFLPPDPLERSGFGLWGVRMLCPLVQIRTDRPGTTVRLRVPFA